MVHFGRLLVAPALLVCAAAAVADAQTEVKPYFMVIVDNSGSMTGTTGGGNNSCGQLQRRLNDAKCVVQKIVNSYGDVVFGLARYKETCSGSCSATCGTSCGCSCTWLDCTGCNDSGSGCPAGGSNANQGEILVPIVEDNHADLLKWVDFTCNSCSTTGVNPELEADTWTPIAGSLRAARRYYESNDPTYGTSPIEIDVYSACRPYHVILLTDGEETCASDAQTLAAATELRSTTVGGVTYDVKTFVIGFGIAAGDAHIEAIANAGGTDAPGAWKGFYATDETTLSLAFAQIIGDSILVETCNGADDDCDGVPDDGFPLGTPCDGPDADLCPEGVLVCNAAGTGTECTDLTGTDVEICNGADDDCDGIVDEPPADCGGCVVQPEICNNLDDDCDGSTDEGLTRPCGTDVGVCTPGIQICTAGVWGPCSGDPPGPESCDGLDNDCDGVADGMAEACGSPPVGSCLPGSTLCTSGMWGPCIGEIGPGVEGCDGIDNDCDGTVDDGDPGGGVPCATSCGAGLTQCLDGMIVCVGGGMGSPEVCNGLDDDCDTLIDEELPPMGPCGTVGTACEGELQCVAGMYQCVGGTTPEPEVCDCLDNDCDGVADDPDPGPLCGAGATCLPGPYCQCARPCAEGEFPCPAGQICTNPGNPTAGFCVVDQCVGVTCLPTPAGEQQVCVDGGCVPVCMTLTCAPPFVCRPADGMCVEDNCNGFPERCDPGTFCVDGECVGDPCATVTCTGPGEYCLGGVCVASCAGLECEAGQSCREGVCVTDPCAGVDCPGTQVCDPADGACRPSQCSVPCPPGEVCEPLTGGCVRDPCLGVVCPAEPPGQVCEGGTCDVPDEPPGVDAGPRTWVQAAGSGCACAVGARRGVAGGAALGLIALAVAAALRRRRR